MDCLLTYKDNKIYKITYNSYLYSQKFMVNINNHTKYRQFFMRFNSLNSVKYRKNSLFEWQWPVMSKIMLHNRWYHAIGSEFSRLFVENDTFRGNATSSSCWRSRGKYLNGNDYSNRENWFARNLSRYVCVTREWVMVVYTVFFWQTRITFWRKCFISTILIYRLRSRPGSYLEHDLD